MNFDVVLIARNESKTLPRLIKSLEEFQRRGGIIHVVDTGSTDGTAKLARSLGCQVTEVGDLFVTTITAEQAHIVNSRFIFEQEEPILKEGDTCFRFDEARNFAASLATNPWVFAPDCDEVLTVLDLNEIENALNEPEVDLLEYEFVYAHDQQNQPLTSFRHSKFYRRDKYQWTGIIHEILTPIYADGRQDKVIME